MPLSTYKSYLKNGNSKMLLMQDDDSMKGRIISPLTHSTSIGPGFIFGMCIISRSLKVRRANVENDA
jgi:hypothetical protein